MSWQNHFKGLGSHPPARIAPVKGMFGTVKTAGQYKPLAKAHKTQANPQCNSCGSITELITCARCGGSGEVDEDLYPGPGQRPAWLQSLVQDSAVTGDDSDDGAEQADDPTTGEDPADDNDQQQQDQ